MLFSIPILLACVGAVNARKLVTPAVLPTVVDPDPIEFIPDPTTSPNPQVPQFVTDCNGSSMCPTLHVKACDIAINFKVIRDNNPNYGAEGSNAPRRGECHGDATDWGCGILIQGPSNCTRTGNEMWIDYQDIRKGGCHHCGHKYWSDWGCVTTIDYFPVCGIWH
ncbi:hypothetical protein F4821DRAFT_59623 [Hypoxylon rubiginosum]|uniref:Uncharacterized protein n=1 Tax=Hypoxylon rubiginosum TaxID=110542 RepID=A0ACC0CJ77_9PEZI|nr:hypothetical protein F4821DRAFT_59623 [Hypoxylon rubiginosum]